MAANIKTLHEKFAQVSGLMNNITDLEFAALERNLNMVVEQQQKQQLELSINDYYSSISSLANEILWRYKNVKEITPVQELKDYVASLKGTLIDVKLPAMDDLKEIFNIYRPVASLQNGLAIVTFKIPLISTQRFIEYVLVSVPDDSQQAILLENDDIINNLVIDENNSTYFDRAQGKQVTENVFSNVMPTVLPPCLAGIIQSAPTAELRKKCSAKTILPQRDVFFRVGESDWAVIISPTASQIKVNCNGTETPLANNFNLLQFSKCSVSNGNTSLNANQFAYLEDKVAQLISPDLTEINATPLEHFTTAPEILELKRQLAKELSEADTWISHSNHTLAWLGLALIAIIAVLIASSWLIYRKLHNGNLTGTDDIELTEKTKKSWVAEWHKSQKSIDGNSIDIQISNN